MSESKEKRVEYISAEDYPPLPEEVAELLGIEQPEEQTPPPLTKKDVKNICQEPGGIVNFKILRYMLETQDAHYGQEVAEELNIEQVKTCYHLVKLHEYGLLSRGKARTNKCRVYYSVINPEGVKIILRRYLQFKGVELARFIPRNRVRVEEVKTYPRFIKKCEKYALSLDEGIEALLSCARQIESERRDNITFLWRKIQGYIPIPPPEEKAVQIEEEPEQVDIEEVIQVE